MSALMIMATISLLWPMVPTPLKEQNYGCGKMFLFGPRPHAT
jgi:hypothetical protein